MSLRVSLLMVFAGLGLLAGPQSGEASPLRVCVMVAKSRAVSKDRLLVLQRTIEEEIDRSFDDALVPSLDCVAAGEALEVPSHKWFKRRYLRQLAASAEVDVVITVNYRSEGEPVRVVALEAMSGDVIGAKQGSWGRIRGIAKSVSLWLMERDVVASP